MILDGETGTTTREEFLLDADGEDPLALGADLGDARGGNLRDEGTRGGGGEDATEEGERVGGGSVGAARLERELVGRLVGLLEGRGGLLLEL